MLRSRPPRSETKVVTSLLWLGYIESRRGRNKMGNSVQVTCSTHIRYGGPVDHNSRCVTAEIKDCFHRGFTEGHLYQSCCI
jgi:hypothetical protein